MAGPLAKQRHLERKIDAAHAWAFDRLYLLDAEPDLDRARFETGDLGVMPPRRTFAEVQETAPAAGECQQQRRAGKIETGSTLHARKNASSFFNDASILTAPESVKDKDSLPSYGCAALIPSVLPIAATAAR